MNRDDMFNWVNMFYDIYNSAFYYDTVERDRTAIKEDNLDRLLSSIPYSGKVVRGVVPKEFAEVVNIPSNEWNEALIDFGNNTEEVLKLKNTEKQGKYVRIWI